MGSAPVLYFFYVTVFHAALLSRLNLNVVSVYLLFP